MQADAYEGFNRLDDASRKPGPIVEAACWAHGRCKFFDLAVKAVQRIDALFAIEREVNARRHRNAYAFRHERSRPLADVVAQAVREASRNSDTGKAIDYMLKRGRHSPAFSMMAVCACRTTCRAELRAP